ncbi:MAG: sporulation protein [Acidimicrobiia bacterium]|nr:sporulation protein [Acidimicrobiia bacterium]
MEFAKSLESSWDALTVRRVFGDPYEKDGVTFIPVAAIRGGGGGGDGQEQDRSGSGGGFGMTARPVGAYRIEGGEVAWIPAFDLTRVIVWGEAVAIVALLVFKSVRKSSHRRG